MTSAEGNLSGVEVNVGDQVTVTSRQADAYRYGTNDRFNLEPGQAFTVTRVYSNSLLIRTVEYHSVSAGWGRNPERRRLSFSVDRMFLTFLEGYVPPPPPRKLGKKPEGEDIIGIDHPGIQWLWDDMGEYAEREGYCSQYDALCVKLGIPGRPRDFTVKRRVNGIDLTTTVKARSQKEANKQVDEALGLTKPQEPATPPEPEFTPAA